MTKEEVKAQVYKWMAEGINSVLNGQEKSVELLYCRPADVIRYIVLMEGEDLNEFDNNGWQWDYWCYVSYGDKRYMIAGDGFYGSTCTFGLVGDINNNRI